MTFANIALLQTARKNLSSFILAKADSVARVVGFGYVDVEHAPNDFDALMMAWKASKRSGLALPVWSGGSENTIYTSCGANYAFRFWHDSIHALTGLAFNTLDEIEIGRIQVQAVQKEFGNRSLESLLMYADTIAQSIYASANDGAFPDNQLEFVTNEVTRYIARLNETPYALPVVRQVSANGTQYRMQA